MDLTQGGSTAAEGSVSLVNEYSEGIPSISLSLSPSTHPGN